MLKLLIHIALCIGELYLGCGLAFHGVNHMDFWFGLPNFILGCCIVIYAAGSLLGVIDPKKIGKP